MLITLILTEGEVPIEADVGSTVRDVLLQANLAPSLHIVDHEGQVLPMNTTLRRDVHLNVTRTASGG